MYLNEGYIIVNDEWYQFQTSDAPAGKTLKVPVLVDAGITNRIKVVIFTTLRHGDPKHMEMRPKL